MASQLASLPTTRTAPRGRRRLTPQAREAFRNELISIARHIFLTEGYAAVTIRRITSSAGVTPMAFYWYFENKDALLTSIWDEIILESATRCHEAASQLQDPISRITVYFGAFLDYWLNHRDHFRLIFLNESPHVDFVALRTHLFQQSGVTRHFQDYVTLAAPLFAGRPDAAEQIDRLRLLSLYKAFGFLHIAIGVYGYSDTEAQAHRDLVIGELRQCLDRWRAAPLADGASAPQG